MKKVISVITLIVMTCVNLMNPFSYAISLGDDFEEIQNFDEIMQEDNDFDDEKNTDNDENNNETIDENEDEKNISNFDENENTQNSQDTVADDNEIVLTENSTEQEEKSEELNTDEISADFSEELTQLSGASERQDDENTKNDTVLDNIHGEEEDTSSSNSPEGGDNIIEKQSFTGKIEDFSGEILTGEEEEFTGEIVILTGSALELATAWKTLNMETITKSERYNKVTVNVEAPAGTFPEGTYANIRAIVSETRLDEIKEQISNEDKTVSEGSEIVAFDITFLYKLSDGTEVEVQPKENTVKVTFNYEDNDELSKADEIDQQEVKVFHIEEVTDEQGNKTGEEKVNDITNKEESVENGIAVADAESFSIYVLTVTVDSDTYTLTLDPQGGTFVADPNITITCDQEHDTHCNGTITVDANGVAKEPRFPNKDGYMFLGWFDAASGGNRFEFEDNPIDSNKTLYAHWAEYEKLNLGGEVNGELITITMMDRNLGAENENHFGYYYQWGNNHGFSISSNMINPSSSIITQRADVSGYSWSNPFYSKYFIKNDDWMSSNNKDLWWGANDDISNYYDDGDYRYKRQGPCPTGYHVPSVKEWFEVVDIFLQKYDIPELTMGGFKYPNQVGVNPQSSSPGGGFNSVKYSLGDNYDSIIDSLGITHNGRIGRSDGKRNRNEGGDKDPRSYLWTSSLKTSSNKEAFVIEFGRNDKVVGVGGFSENNAMGFGVRCFKDESDVRVVKFELNGGTWDSSNPKYLTYDKEQGIVLPSEEPELYAYNFDGWYTSEDDGITFDDKVEDGDKVGNVVLYAKYTHKPTYQINFVIEGVSYSQYLMEGEIPSYDGIPTKPDQGEFSYTFDGWTDGTTKYDVGEDLPEVTGPATYTAIFDEYVANKYKVTYDTDGDGTEDNVQYVSKVEGENIINLPVAPTKEGYDFGGWKANNEENPRAAESEYTVIADVDFTAQWTPHDYSIVYDYDGGTLGRTNPATYNVEDNMRDIYSPTKTNNKFVGWKEYSCNESDVANCQNWILVRDVLVYGDPTSIVIGGIGHKKYVAQWVEMEVEYTVIWITDDLSNPIKVSQEAVGTHVSTIKPADPTKAADPQYSYSFLGWTKGNSDTIIQDWTSEIVTDFVIYKAKFSRTVNQYKVTFVNEDGTSVIKVDSTDEYDYREYNYGSGGVDIVVPAAPDKAGYHFDGWLKKTGDDTYSSDVVNMDTEVIIENTIYKAKYSPIIEEYTITFITDGGTEIAPITGHVGDPVITPNNPQKTGYRFSGWDATIPQNMPSENLTITAIWTPIIYNIIYTGVEEGYVGTGTYTIEDTFTIPNPENKVGYSFKGWREYVDMDETGLNPDWQEILPGQIYYNPSGLTINSGNTLDRKYVAQWEVKTYTVFWVDENLTVLETDNDVPYGTTPSYDKQNPSKEDTAQRHYEFVGWKIAGDDTIYNNGNFPTISGNTLYKASYSTTIRKYSITFVDEDGTTILGSGEYEYGTQATNIQKPADPEKEDTPEWNYEFGGWSPEIADVVKNETYIATYSSSKQKYGITFVDENGTTILQETILYDYGTHPEYNGELPIKPDDEQGHTFEFEGWDDGTDEYLSGQELPTVTTGVTYKAVYASSTSQYEIEFNPNEGDVSQTSKTVTYGQEYGELPIPQRRGYEFTGWYTDPIAGTQITSGTIVGITARNQTLYAHWDIKTYSVSYYDTDEEHPITVMGATTGYRIDSTITIPVLEKEGYTFIGWKEYVDGEYTRAYLNEGNPIIVNTGNVGNRKYIAKWNTEGHVVVWENWDGVIIDMNIGVSPDTSVSTLEPQGFSKPADAQYTYTFNGWTKNGEPVDISTEIVTSDIRYKATYTGTINKYKIKFVDEDGTPLKDEIEYEYGTHAEAITRPDNPEKEDTIEWDYEFVGWSPEISDVTTGVTYTATYSSTKQKYEVIFYDENETTVLGSGKYDYGTVARDIDTPDNPTKPATDGYTYNFSGWNPSIKEVTGNQTYIASYTPIPDKYTITFDAQGGVFLSAMIKIVTYGQEYGELPTPTKLGNNFLGWYTDPTAGTQITSGSTVDTGAKNQTLYTHWEKQTYNVSYYDTDEGHPITVTGATTIYTVDDFISIPNITKEGYTFVGWKEVVEGEPDRAYLSDGVNPTKIPSGNVGDRKYIALWNQHGYIIVWTNDDDTILEIDPEVGHGNTPAYNGTTPTKAETDEFTYEFAGWSPEIEPATKRQTYKAKYTPHKKPYLITFIDSENDVIQTGNYEYGTTAEQLMAIAPTLLKTGDKECKTYEGRWTPEIVDVTGPATYTSIYTCIEKEKYTITWKDWDGEILEKDTNAEYGTLPTYHGKNPEKEIGDGKTYTFTWWSIDGENIIKPLPNVTGDATYTAVYTDDPNIYGVTFDPKGGVVVPYYQNVTYEQPYGNMPNPTRNGYHFDGWYDAEIGGQKIEATTIFRLTDDQTLYAYWTPITYNIMYEEVDSGYLAPTSYTVLSRIEIPHPNKEGHKFLGWKEYICNKTDINQCSGTDREHIGNILKEGDNTTLPEGTTLNRKYVAQWEVNEYAVTWISNGNLLKVNMLPYGSIPVYSREVPFREPDAQYTYTFTGWSDGIKEYGKDENLPEVNGIVTYSAIFSSTTNKYNISFVDEDGTPLQSTQLEYGEIPSYDTGTYGIPVKEGNAQYTYTFAGWTPEISEVITGATYKATYTGTINKYNISFVDEDGITVLGSGEYEYGTPATNIEKPSNPTKTGDVQYTYTFAGWMPEISEVITGTTYKATYTGTINKYTVTFDSDGGSEIDPITVDYGTGIQAPEEPIKRGYTFLKWQKVEGETLSDYDFETPVTQDITLKAIWTKDNYTVVYKDGNETMTIPGATTGYTITDEIIIPNPEKEGYTFVAWKEYVKTGENTRNFVKDILKDGESITIGIGNIGDREFRAQWRVNQYTVTFTNYDMSILKVETLNYGSGVIYDKLEPRRIDETGQYTYTFSGWSDGVNTYGKDEILPAVSGNVTYVAYFDQTVNEYEIIFYDEDGTTVLGSGEYEYGTPVDTIKPADPEKEDTPEWNYEFGGWSPAVSDVTTGAIYTATYTQTKQKYEVKFVDEDGITVLGSGEYEYGTDARLIEHPANPTKADTDEYRYTFGGWTPTIVNVTGDATYTATYNSTTKQYKVTFYDEDGTTVLGEDVVDYGETARYPNGIPTKARTNQYTYEFLDWYNGTGNEATIDNLSNVTADRKVYAKYSATINEYEIIFYDEDGTTVLWSGEYEYGTPVNTIKPTDPEKEDTPEWDYEFGGWSPAVSDVTTGAIYTATYTQTKQKYEVKFVDEDGITVLGSGEYEYGTDARLIERPANPTKADTDEYRYTFGGWIPTIVNVTGDATYTATYNSTTKQYTVTFDSDGGSSVDPITVDYGTGIQAPEEPTKRGYTFLKWQKVEGETLSDYDFETPVTQDITLKAIWTKDNYTVVYKDGNETMTIPGATTGYTITDEIIIPNPEKEGYTFVAWKEYVKTGENTRNFVKDILKDGESITIGTGNIGDREFRAQWRVNQYTVTFYDEDGELVLGKNTVNYGEDATYRSDAPKKAKTEQYSYEFLNWYNGTGNEAIVDNLSNVTADRKVYAKYSATINEYEIIFYDEDGTTVLLSGKYEYGAQVEDITKPANPTKPDTPEWDYEFASWSPEFKPVTGNQTYTATYSGTKQKYKVTFYDEDGITVLGSGEYEYGTDARLIERPVDPTKTETDEYTYTFAGWAPTIENVTTGATYIATYTESANQYTITFDTQGSSTDTGTTKVVTYGETYGELPIPTKLGNEFLGWYTDPIAGTEITSGTTVNTGAKNQILYAHWEIKNYIVSYFDQDGTTELIIPSATTGYTVNDPIIIPNPTKDEYVFVGWKEYVDGQYVKAYLSEGTGITIPAGNVGNRRYVAQWNNNVNGYVVLWIDWNNVIIDMNTDVGYGTIVANIQKPADPTREADAQYSYTFANWTKDDVDIADISAEVIIGNVRYKAKYNESLNKYKVKFVDEDGITVLKEEKEYNYGTSVEDIEKPSVHIKTGWKFSGWSPELSMVAENVTYKAVYEINQYTIAFDTNGGSIIAPITQNYDTPINVSNPTKEGYTFKGWIPSLPSKMPAENITVVAQWEASGGDGGGGGSGGGGSSSGGGGGGKSSKKSSTGDIQDKIDDNIEENIHGSAGDEGNEYMSGTNQDHGNIIDTIDPESLDAYEWARENGITTINSIEWADPDGYVTRGHLAKMLVNFVTKVLGRNIPYDVSYECVNWNDDPSIWESDEIRDYATKSCALGIMGINTRNNEFMPNDIVTRAEFGTVASRILWGDTYNQMDAENNPFYVKHLKALQDSGFMKDIDNPLGRWEIRKRVWLVLKRIETKK